ncbi:arginine N-succinyltransferase [Simiduia agarivorans]|uniref:Arginine N-succinyltransferase n=1 Tax=Simiduia agarivorans (strain DSM 21679 / JCM 13881 / BCRC 17597 / SA1) TaxID=1117647 RepID=K4KJY6_SIMAS|nr:arginine N-succinyltransferase [Simiduia agarivorans]AFU99311.1 arginine N-succinyltransferase [Simiduia agarivorans SA1 = DSM 21679]
MIIRPASMADRNAIQQLVTTGQCWFGDLYLRELQLEEKLAQSEISFSAEDDQAPANFWFVLETEGAVTAAIELQTLAGYELHCLSYCEGQMLHRSDALGICHSQKIYGLDAGLLGMDQLTLGLTQSRSPEQLEALLKHLLNFRRSQQRFRQALCIALPGVNGPAFWAATGEKLIAVDYRELRYAHAELLPQAQYPECFIADALAHLGSDTPIAGMLEGLGFVRTRRFSPLDGGAIWQVAGQASGQE